MVLSSVNNNIKTNLDDAQVFGINADASMFDILSKKLYSNPIQSVIRELVSNAIDANTAAGQEDPIQVHFPNDADPTFWVRDTGVGMDAEKLMNVFTYGGSDKRDTNKQIGGLGVGAKSPFSVTDSFTVESTKDGVKRTAICFRGPDGCPRFKMIGEEEGFVNGTKIYFNVSASNFYNYIYESVPVFAFAKQMPEILNGKEKFLEEVDCASIEEFEKIRELLKKDAKYKSYYYSRNELTEQEQLETKLIRNITRRFSGVIVDMGGVPYDVDISQVFDEYAASCFFHNDASNAVTILHFPIGSLNFQASREKLNYTEETKQKLRRKLINFAAHKDYEILKSA